MISKIFLFTHFLYKKTYSVDKLLKISSKNEYGNKLSENLINVILRGNNFYIDSPWFKKFRVCVMQLKIEHQYSTDDKK